MQASIFYLYLFDHELEIHETQYNRKRRQIWYCPFNKNSKRDNPVFVDHRRFTSISSFFDVSKNVICILFLFPWWWQFMKRVLIRATEYSSRSKCNWRTILKKASRVISISLRLGGYSIVTLTINFATKITVTRDREDRGHSSDVIRSPSDLLQSRDISVTPVQ